MDPAEQISAAIAASSDWQGEIYAVLRRVILAADPAITEQWKWGTAVWTFHGNLCAIAAFNDHVKINFFHGAALDEYQHLFNAGLDAKETRAIDFHEGDKVDESAISELVRAAVTINNSRH